MKLPLLVALILSNAAGPPSGETTPDRKMQSFRAAVEQLDASLDTKGMVRAMAILRDGFPACRPILLECAEKGSLKAKCFALQVLGEKGDPREDMDTVTRALGDGSPKVRLAAVMALRRLGKGGLPALLAQLQVETDPNNRKMAVKTIQLWKETDAIPDIVRALRKEKEKTVRNFMVTALEALSGKKLGDNLAAWEAYADGMALRDQAIQILSTQNHPATNEENKK